MPERQRWYVKDIGKEYETGDTRKPVGEDTEANLVGSAITDSVYPSGVVLEDSLHMPVLDIDMQVDYSHDAGTQLTTTHFYPQHFFVEQVDKMSDFLIRHGMAVAVHTKGGSKPIVSVVWGVPIKGKSSWTPGHNHIFIEHILPWNVYREMLDLMGDAQILEDGYVLAGLERCGTFVATKPWKESHRKEVQA